MSTLERLENKYVEYKFWKKKKKKNFSIYNGWSLLLGRIEKDCSSLCKKPFE